LVTDVETPDKGEATADEASRPAITTPVRIPPLLKLIPTPTTQIKVLSIQVEMTGFEFLSQGPQLDWEHTYRVK